MPAKKDLISPVVSGIIVGLFMFGISMLDRCSSSSSAQISKNAQTISLAIQKIESITERNARMDQRWDSLMNNMSERNVCIAKLEEQNKALSDKIDALSGMIRDHMKNDMRSK